MSRLIPNWGLEFQGGMAGLGLTLEKPGQPSTMSPGEQWVRTRVVEALLWTYRILNERGRFSKFTQINTTPLRRELYSINSYWSPVALDSRAPSAKILAPTAHPLVALGSLQRTPGMILDCTSAGAIALVAIHASIAVIPPESFRGGLPHLVGLFKTFYPGKRQPPSGLRAGDQVYYINVGDYLTVHPHGSAQGEKTFFLGYNSKGERVYIGFGGIYRGGPVGGLLIRESLADAYLAAPDFPCPCHPGAGRPSTTDRAAVLKGIEGATINGASHQVLTIPFPSSAP